MSTITVQEIQADPGKFLERIEAGEPLLVTREERVVARVQPVGRAASGLRPYGLAAGQFITPPEFDQPLPEDIILDFERA